MYLKLHTTTEKNDFILLTTASMEATPAQQYHNFHHYGLPNSTIELTGNLSEDILSWIKGFERRLGKHVADFQVEGIHFRQLFEEGILNIPIRFSYQQKSYCLFFIYDQLAAQKFKDARKQLTQHTNYEALYLSKIDLTKVKTSMSCLEVFGFKDLSIQEHGTSAQQFKVWWPTKSDPTFQGSLSEQYLEEIHQSISGYATYFVGHLLSAIKIHTAGSKQIRVALPTKEQQLLIKGPEHQTILLALSKEKGISFRFPVGRVSQRYRELFLDQLRTSIQAYRLMLSLREVEMDQ